MRHCLLQKKPASILARSSAVAQLGDSLLYQQPSLQDSILTRLVPGSLDINREDIGSTAHSAEQRWTADRLWQCTGEGWPGMKGSFFFFFFFSLLLLVFILVLGDFLLPFYNSPD